MKWNFLYKLQLPPEPLTRGLPPPDPRSLCPLSSTEFVEPPPPPPEQNSWVHHCWTRLNGKKSRKWWQRGRIVPALACWTCISLFLEDPLKTVLRCRSMIHTLNYISWCVFMVLYRVNLLVNVLNSSEIFPFHFMFHNCCSEHRLL